MTREQIRQDMINRCMKIQNEFEIIMSQNVTSAERERLVNALIRANGLQESAFKGEGLSAVTINGRSQPCYKYGRIVFTRPLYYYLEDEIIVSDVIIKTDDTGWFPKKVFQVLSDGFNFTIKSNHYSKGEKLFVSGRVYVGITWYCYKWDRLWGASEYGSIAHHLSYFSIDESGRYQISARRI